MHTIFLKNIPIFEQLLLEESLLRDDDRSFMIINVGSPRSIVMGISGKPELLLNLSKVREDRIPVIRRFSGGGTVIVDENTLFISFIIAKKDVQFPPFPEYILNWSAALYHDAWHIPGFQLRENDYVIGDRKCGGNAQYIRKNRWIHHTSFLWDYLVENMHYLLLPQKRPAYRGDRPHDAFLSRLSSNGCTLEERIIHLKKAISKQFEAQPLDIQTLTINPLMRHSTCLIDFI